MNPRHAALAAALSCPLAVMAADDFPSRPITLVVPFSPGGVSDTTARPLAPLMAKRLGQSVIIENRPGAGGGVGMAHVAKAAPDGYTLMMALPSISAIPAADRLTGKTPSYATSQFMAIARMSADPTVLVVRNDAPWKSVQELVQAAKARPGTVSYSSSGIYGTTHVAMERFAHAAGIKLLHVPYGGGGEQVTALLGGHVQASTQTYGNISGHIKSGKFRPLAVQGAERLASLPDVPTMKELGYDAEYYLWAGLFAPAGVPEPVMMRLRAAVRDAVADPAFSKAMAGMGTPVQYQDAADFEAFWRTDERHQTQVINSIGKLE